MAQRQQLLCCSPFPRQRHRTDEPRKVRRAAKRTVSKISNAHVFEPLLSRAIAGKRLIEELLYS